MRIVKKGNEFALAKRWWIFTEIADLSMYGFWWSPNNFNQRDCWGTLEEVKLAKAFWEKTHRKWENV